MQLTEIPYPIYKIRHYIRIYEDSNIVYIETKNNTWILDNKNLPYKSYIQRRLNISENLYPLTRVIFTPAQLIRDNSTNKLYITKDGKLIKYTKTIYVPLLYKRINKLIKLNNRYAFIVQDMPSPLIISHLEAKLFEEDDYKYIGILETKAYGLIYYEMSKTKKKDTRRKI